MMKNESLILSMKFGSHLYGTNTPSSDLDYKSVYLPSGRDIVLQRIQDVRVSKTKTGDSVKNSSNDIDNESFALHKFVNLLAKGQTVALDMFFANQEMIEKGENYKPWIELQINKNRILSRQCQSFIGYCRQQANKYGIKGSRMFEAEKAADFFSSKVALGLGKSKLYELSANLYGLCENADHTEIVRIKNPNGLELEHFSCCNRKAPFTITVKEASNIYTALYEQYGKRAELAKENQGVDWKAVSHAVRVGTQALELLYDHTITMPRPNRDFLVAIKTGRVDFQTVSVYIEYLMENVEIAAKNSTLPPEPDWEWIEDFVAYHYSKQVRGDY